MNPFQTRAHCERTARRIAGLGSWREGFTRNTNADARARGFGRLDSKDVWALRGQLAYDGGGPLTARLSVEHLNDESNLPAYKYLNRPDSLPTADFSGFDNPRTVNQGFEPAIPGFTRGVGDERSDFFLTRQTGVALHLGYDLGAVNITSITGYRRTRFNWFNDGDGSDVFSVNYIQQDRSEQYTQEIQLSSDYESRLNWIVGGFYLSESGESFIALPFTLGFALPFYIAIEGEAETTAYAVFGELRWRPVDRLTLTVGGRYATEDRAARYRYEVNFGTPFIRTPDDKANFDAFTPRFVVNYEASNDVSIFASVTRGFKSGGFNLLAVQPGFQPETVWSYEGGIKSQFFDRKLTLNGNVFYYDYTNQQVGQIVNLQSVLTNAASSRLWGFELEARATPTRRLEIGSTVAYLNSQYEKFCTGDPTQPTAPISPGCDAANPIDLAGNRLPRAPEWAVTGTVGYRFALGDVGSVYARTDVRWQSQLFFTQFNRPLISQDDFTTVNASLTWTDARERFSVGVFAQNLTDEIYYTEVLESGAFNPQLVAQAYVAPPRTYGLRASVRF